MAAAGSVLLRRLHFVLRAVSKIMDSAELTVINDLYCFWCGTEITSFPGPGNEDILKSEACL